mmetsp:Transcript_37285/g.81191  ORF Transcript_37285/g.81191 Transcript_37285/m.81191 type:complete len:91 (+) Transcript_37285:932-1204(+)
MNNVLRWRRSSSYAQRRVGRSCVVAQCGGRINSPHNILLPLVVGYSGGGRYRVARSSADEVTTRGLAPPLDMTMEGPRGTVAGTVRSPWN